MTPPRRKMRLNTWFLACVLWCAAFSVAFSADKPDVANSYQRMFARFVDNRSMPEKALNLVGLTQQDVGRSFALIAGVSDYPRMSVLASGSKLESAASDRDELVDYLTKYEFFDEVIVLWNGDMTAKNLDYFLSQYFPARMRQFPNSRFLLAYSGHGFADGNNGYLLKNGATSLSDKANAVSIDSLRVSLKPTIAAAHQSLVLLNSCYGGTLVDRKSSGGEYRPRLPGAHAITAGASDELTWHDGKIGKGSVFFEKVFAGLGGAANLYPLGHPNGIITASELYAYLRAEVQISTDQRQNPQFGDIYPTQSKGEFFFLSRAPQYAAALIPAWNGSDRAASAPVPSASPGGLPSGWGLYSSEVPIAPNQVTAIVTTLGSFGRKDITISGGALRIDLAVSATDGLARYERLQMRTNFVEQTIDGDFSPAFGQPPQRVKLSLALGAIVTMRRPTGDLRIMPTAAGGFKIDDFDTSGCSFNCYNFELVGYWKLSKGSDSREGRIYLALTGVGIGADTAAEISGKDLPRELQVPVFSWHGNTGGARLGEAVDTTIGGAPIRVQITYGTFPEVKGPFTLRGK